MSNNISCRKRIYSAYRQVTQVSLPVRPPSPGALINDLEKPPCPPPAGDANPTLFPERLRLAGTSISVMRFCWDRARDCRDGPDRSPPRSPGAKDPAVPGSVPAVPGSSIPSRLLAGRSRKAGCTTLETTAPFALMVEGSVALRPSGRGRCSICTVRL